MVGFLHGPGAADAAGAGAGGPFAVAVVGAKGGVGRSTLSLNLAAAMAGAGDSVLLLDANRPAGDLANLLGCDAPSCLADLAAPTPPSGAGAPIVPVLPGIGLAAWEGGPGADAGGDGELLLRNLEAGTDWIVADTGTGLDEADLAVAVEADAVLLVVAPELPAVADGYATLKALEALDPGRRAACVVNLADSAAEAEDIHAGLQELMRSFLGAQIDNWGYIPFHRDVRVAARRQTPFVHAVPSSPATAAIAHLVENLTERRAERQPRGSTFLDGLLRRSGDPSHRRRAPQQEVRASP